MLFVTPHSSINISPFHRSFGSFLKLSFDLIYFFSWRILSVPSECSQTSPLSGLHFFFLYSTAIKNVFYLLLSPSSNSICTCGLLSSHAQFLFLPHSISTHSLLLLACSPALSPYTTSFSTFQPIKKRKTFGSLLRWLSPSSVTAVQYLFL